MRLAGARTIAQDEATSVAFGMPRVALEGIGPVVRGPSYYEAVPIFFATSAWVKPALREPQLRGQTPHRG